MRRLANWTSGGGAACSLCYLPLRATAPPTQRPSVQSAGYRLQRSGRRQRRPSKRRGTSQSYLTHALASTWSTKTHNWGQTQYTSSGFKWHPNKGTRSLSSSLLQNSIAQAASASRQQQAKRSRAHIRQSPAGKRTQRKQKHSRSSVHPRLGVGVGRGLERHARATAQKRGGAPSLPTSSAPCCNCTSVLAPKGLAAAGPPPSKQAAAAPPPSSKLRCLTAAQRVLRRWRRSPRRPRR